MAGFDYPELYTRLERLTSAFSSGGPGFQFFRLEQWEIGERFVGGSAMETFSPMTLSTFLDRLDDKGRPRWMKTLCARSDTLLREPAPELDRLQKIDESVTALLTFLDDAGRWAAQEGPPAIDAEAIRKSHGLARRGHQRPIDTPPWTR